MFFDSDAWPPTTGGDDPPQRRMGPAQERTLMRIVAVVLIATVFAPFAGSSVIDAVVAMFR